MKRNGFVGKGLLVLSAIALLGVACGRTQQPPILVSDKPVDYKLPAPAEILEQHASSVDFFGDYSYYASFELPDSEIGELIEKGFDWVTSDGRRIPSEGKPEWKTGPLPENIFERIDGALSSGPDSSTTYRYLYYYVEGGQWRLFVIDEEKGIVYYYRVSW